MNDIGSDESWVVWEKLNAECEKRRAEVQQLLQAVRAARRIPKRETEQILQQVRRLLSSVRDANLEDIDRKEFVTFVKRQIAVLTFLLTHAHADIEPSSTQIQVLLDTENVPEELSDRVARYQAQTMLVILSRPSGSQYWQLLRTVANCVRNERKSHRTPKLDEIQDVLNFLAPPRLLYNDREPIPTVGKWAWRTTKVNGIYNGGLPGLGKNA